MLYEPIDSTSEKEVDKLLLKHFSRQEFGLFGHNKTCLPAKYKDVYQKIKDFEVRDDDVYVISIIKAGTTWTQEMVWLIANNLDYEGAKKDINHRFPFLELEGLLSKSKRSEETDVYESLNSAERLDANLLLDSVTHVEVQPSPRFIKTHLPWELLPNQIIKGNKKPKIIYTSRSIKDCLISLYYHTIMLDGYKGSFDDFYKLFIHGKMFYSPYWPHVLDYWKRRHLENVMFIKYEDMKHDLLAVIKEVCLFFEKNYTDKQLKKLAEHLSFDNMKKNPAVNKESLVEKNRNHHDFDKNLTFMRRGKVGDFKVHMSPKQIADIDELSRESVMGSDYKMTSSYY